ncbi:MAG: PTS sugar transporter subunit IIA [Kineothrix sp.]|nr:PTS sugar transporter subunit IIA [Kineothrix sp.]
MKNYVSAETTALKQCAGSWEEAVRYAGRLLEEAGTIKSAYTNAMVTLVKELGPYIVVMPGVALAHARPAGNVWKNSIAVITLEEGVNFGNESNDPVFVVFAVAACNDDEHLDLFQTVAEFLEKEENVERLMNARTFQEIGF